MDYTTVNPKDLNQWAAFKNDGRQAVQGINSLPYVLAGPTAQSVNNMPYVLGGNSAPYASLAGKDNMGTIYPGSVAPPPPAPAPNISSLMALLGLGAGGGGGFDRGGGGPTGNSYFF